MTKPMTKGEARKWLRRASRDIAEAHADLKAGNTRLFEMALMDAEGALAELRDAISLDSDNPRGINGMSRDV